MMTVRQTSILKRIIKHPEGITGQKLSEELKVSSKTIRNDLVQLNNWLCAFHTRISASRTFGYYIKAEDMSGIRECLRAAETAGKDKHAESPMERKYYILGKVLGRTKISFYELAERLYVSEQTIYKDVIYLQQSLQMNYNFEGIRIENGQAELWASESEIRNLVFRIIQTQVSSANKLMDINLYQLVKDVTHLEEIHKFVEYISCYCDETETLISDQILFISAWAVFYTNVRTQEGHSLTGADKRQTDSLPFDKDDDLSRFLKKINMDWFLDFEDKDYRLLYHFLEALGFLTLGSKSVSNEAEYVCMELIAKAKEMYGVDFYAMPSLAEEMKRHLEYAVRRIKLDYQLTNPFREEVKKKYLFSYQIALLLVPLLYDVYQKYPTEDEVSFFAVYIQTCLQMQSVTVNVLLVYGTTLGYLSLIENWLKREFASRIRICGFCPQYKLQESCKKQEINLVISTVSLDLELPIPCIVISQLPTEKDRRGIDQLMTKAASQDYGDMIFSQLFLETRVLFFDRGESFDQIIKDCAARLGKEGCITNEDSFSQAVLQREAVYPTLIDHGCYLPHPLTNQAIKNGICTGIVRDSIHRDPDVKVVFVMALESKIDQRFQKIYNFIQSMAASPLTVENLKNLGTPGEVMEYLQNMMKII